MNVASVLAQLRATTPLVHCLTNTVVPQITANVLLAAGAAPAMIDLPEEAEIFAGIASAVLINVGNGSSEQHAAQRAAASAAHEAGTPWVLDPVGRCTAGTDRPGPRTAGSVARRDPGQCIRDPGPDGRQHRKSGGGLHRPR